MASPWSIPAMGWMFTVQGWLLSPVISFYLQKLFAYLVFDASIKLPELELDTIPALKATLREVEEQRMVRAARDEEGSRSDLHLLHKMDLRLKSALCQAEDILDLVDYHRIEKELEQTGGNDSNWGVLRLIHAAAGAGSFIVARCCRGGWVCVQRLLNAAGACVVACWTGILIQRCIDITPDRLLQFVQSMKQKLGQLFGGISRLWSSGANVRLPVSQATTTVGVQIRVYAWCRQLVANITGCCLSLLSWSTHAIEAAGNYRDWSYEQVGIISNLQEDGSAAELVPITERISLMNRIKGIEDILAASKKSDLLKDKNSSSGNAQNSDKENCAKEIDDLCNPQEVFGREEDRKHISRMLRKGPADTNAASSSTSKPYSVIGIDGITGSGKSTLAKYVCDYEKGAGHFNCIMFILVGKKFSIGDIFRDMLEQITQSRPSSDDGLKSLKSQLLEKLKDKRLLLILDDVWVSDENQKERDILLDTLSAAQTGSRILVTAQKKDAAEALGAQEQISISDLKEEVYLSLFMHHARPDASDDDGEYERIGRKIANRLHRSPIAAVTVGKQLRRNKSISFW